MDKIWDGNLWKSEVIDRRGGDDKTTTTQNRQIRTLKNVSSVKNIQGCFT